MDSLCFVWTFEEGRELKSFALRSLGLSVPLQALDGAIDQAETANNGIAEPYLEEIDDTYYDYGLAWQYFLPLLAETVLFGTCSTDTSDKGL